MMSQARLRRIISPPPVPLACLFSLLIVTALRTEAEPYKPVAKPPHLIEEAGQLRFMSFDKKLATLRSLPPEKKRLYADALRNFDPDLSYHDSRQNRSNFNDLMALGDPITGRYLIRQFEISKTDPIAENLSRWHSPEALAAFAREVMSDEPYPNTPGEPVSFICTGPMIGLVAKIEEFPPQVRAWAKSIEHDQMAWHKKKSRETEALPEDVRNWDWEADHRLDKREREVAQKWWRANEKAVLEGRLKDAVPGEPFVAPSKFLLGVTEVWRPEANSTTSLRSGQGANQSNSPNSSPAQSAEPGSSYAVGLWLAGSAIALAALAVWLRSRR